MLVHLKYCIVHYTLGLVRGWKIITHPYRSHFEGGLICSIIGSKCVHKDSHINKSNYIITAFPIQLVFNSYSQAGGPFSTCVFSPPTLRAGRILLLHGKTAAISPPFSLSPVSTVVVVTLYYGGFSYCISITECVNSSGNTKKITVEGRKMGKKESKNSMLYESDAIIQSKHRWYL